MAGHRPWKWITAVWFLLLVVVPMSGGWAEEQAIRTLNEPEPLRDRLPATAKGLIAARCLVCHSEDLITQQRLTRTQWTATVEKMVRWGAKVSESERAVLADYLASRYHPEAGQVAEEMVEPEPTASLPTVSTGDASRGDDLYRRNCLACHGASAAGGFGPQLARNPILSDDPGFWSTVLRGRGGMPPWAAVLTPQEIADIQAWLKAL